MKDYPVGDNLDILIGKSAESLNAELGDLLKKAEECENVSFSKRYRRKANRMSRKYCPKYPIPFPEADNAFERMAWSVINKLVKR